MKNIYLGILTILLSASINAQGPVTSICMVTVDSTSTHNIVIWERLDQVSVNPIDSMKVFRQDVSGGNYTLIATVPYAALSEYEDLGADPNVQAYSYKIAGYDSAGQLGALSAEATTIHLSVVSSDLTGIMGLSWSGYVGGSVTNYSCLHVTAALGDTTMITTGSGTSLNWDMLSPNPGEEYEMYSVANGTGGCTSTKANHNTSRSNKSTGGIMLPVEVQENNIVNLKLYPNPATNEVNLNFSSRKLSTSTVRIYNLVGELVYSTPATAYYGQQSVRLDVSNFTSGLYLISVQNGNHIKTLRFSKK